MITCADPAAPLAAIWRGIRFRCCRLLLGIDPCGSGLFQSHRIQRSDERRLIAGAPRRGIQENRLIFYRLTELFRIHSADTGTADHSPLATDSATAELIRRGFYPFGQGPKPYAPSNTSRLRADVARVPCYPGEQQGVPRANSCKCGRCGCRRGADHWPGKGVRTTVTNKQPREGGACRECAAVCRS